MIKKSIITIVVIVATAALVFGASNHTNSTGNSDQEQSLSADNSASDSSTEDTTSENKISPAEAQEIAKKYIEEPEASAGTPTLSKIDSTYIYTVPVILNGTNVGEININAITGKNVGGAGGAP